MRGDPLCPRCHGKLRSPSVWEASWTCPVHGRVEPLWPFAQPSTEFITWLADEIQLPAWLPWPLPHGWVLTGAGYAGRDPKSARASVVACSGPNPLGGAGELMLVAEDMGVGVGAGYAALPGPDPGESIGRGGPQAKVEAAGRLTPLWVVPGPDDRAIYVGEAEGHWLWLVLYPETAGALLLDLLQLADMRGLGHEIELLPYGALTPRMYEP
jgi:hypothetical protein